MKAAQINDYGGADALKINNDAARPTLADDQILIQVHAAGVNPFDYKIREGMVRQIAELNFPATLGGDVAGIIAEIGSKVTNFKTGEAIYGQAGSLSGQGSFAEYVPVNAASVAHKPARVDFIKAAGLPLVSVSAYQAVVELIDIQKDQKILIHGGAGGIGSMAIQLAKHFGAYVATTVGSTNVDYVKSLGADEIIDYHQQDFSALLKDYDAVFDTVGGDTNAKSYTVLAPGSTFVSMVEQIDQQRADQYKIKYIREFTGVTTERLIKIAKLIDDNVLDINIDKVFSLNEAAEAVEYVKTGHPRGKVVIRISE